MKTKIISIIALVAMAAVMTFSMQASGKGDACMEFKESIYDFGDIPASGGKVSHVFKFENTGGKNLLIAGASADCGCTEPEFSDAPVAPGKTGTVKVTYQPSGRGHFSKKVTLRTNGKPRKVRLIIKGNVVP